MNRIENRCIRENVCDFHETSTYVFILLYIFFLNFNVKRIKMVILDTTAVISVLLLIMVKPVAQSATVLILPSCVWMYKTQR